MNLAEAKAEAHAVFDRLWKSGRTTRSGAYKLMTTALRLPRRLHIADLSVAQCEELIRCAAYTLEKIPKPKRRLA